MLSVIVIVMRYYHVKVGITVLGAMADFGVLLISMLMLKSQATRSEVLELCSVFYVHLSLPQFIILSS